MQVARIRWNRATGPCGVWKASGVVSLPPPRRRSVLLSALGVLVLLGLLVSWRVWQVRGDLLEARDYAEALRAAGEERDLGTARIALDALREHAGGAADGTSGPSWWLLEHLPVVGDDAEAVATMAQALSGLADAADPLLGIAEDVDRGRVSPVDGRLPLATIAGFREPVDRFAAALERSRSSVAALRGSYAGQLGDARAELLTELDAAQPRVDDLATVVARLPVALGEGAPRRYLVVFQNNGEIRATGGLPGSAAEVSVQDGRIELRKAFSPIELDKRRPARFDFTSAEKRLYGPLLLARPAVFVNSMPDARRATNLLAEGARRWLGHRVDGVVLMDTVTLGYLLDATGPIEVKGVTLSADDAVRQLLYGTYARIPDRRAQDRFFEAVSAKVFSQLTSSGVDVGRLVDAVRRSIDERRTILTFQADALRPLADVAAPETSGPVVPIGLNDVGGGKMSYFLRADLAVDAGCSASQVRLAGRVSLFSAAPRDASGLPQAVDPDTHWQPVRPGGQIVQVVVRLPTGWRLEAMEVDGRRAKSLRTERTRSGVVALVQAEVMPKSTRAVTWRAVAPIGTAMPSVQMTPGVVAGPPATEVPASPC